MASIVIIKDACFNLSARLFRGHLRRRYLFIFPVVILSFSCRQTQLPELPPNLNDSALLRSLDLDNPKPENASRIVQLYDRHSKEICERATKALAQIGEPAIPALVEGLRKDAPIGRRVQVKYTLPTFGQAAIPPLLIALEDEAYERTTIIEVLGEIQPTTSEVISAFVAALGNEKGDPGAFYMSIQALDFLDDQPEVKAAVPALSKVLGHENKKIRFRAAQVLWQIDPDAAYRAGVRDWGSRIVEE